ncbi:Nitronate monooxygenase [Slackia heliotrinireducens]|uniref:2-nitropropane dioxygenase-like enzyme n=1 Tax=Slackia heliotrinireducens (strain ATCC 29202 / DSM 20476 / NCTC 11029 / RHS 1) TaxID=471855 RepID=C7N2S6_SLAHD|nr:2-nitropropane dioxygenase-like enzyme [Slackia heliotrinireducens DSM 20476]VEH03036.1 Nitronate monooxygenase [Slackia heliotrinireducens]
MFQAPVRNLSDPGVPHQKPVVTFVGEPNKSMIRMFGQFKERGIKIVYRSLNPTPENTRAAEEAGADIIVATGFDEGGTLPSMTLETFSIVPLIKDTAKNVPVMAAGGIADRRAFNAAFALGAEGVYCGTAFLMCEESRMASNVKQTLLSANARDDTRHSHDSAGHATEIRIPEHLRG